MAHAHSQTRQTSSHKSVSEQVVAAIAEREETSPTALEECLYEVLDPDALDDLFRDGRLHGSVAFNYCGYRVAVHADGRIDVHDLDE